MSVHHLYRPAIVVAPHDSNNAWYYGLGAVPSADAYDLYFVHEHEVPLSPSQIGHAGREIDLTVIKSKRFRSEISPMEVHAVLAREYGEEVSRFGIHDRGFVVVGGTGSMLRGVRCIGFNGVAVRSTMFSIVDVLDDAAIAAGRWSHVNGGDRCAITAGMGSYVSVGEDSEVVVGKRSAVRCGDAHVTAGAGTVIQHRTWDYVIVVGETAGQRCQITARGVFPT